MSSALDLRVALGLAVAAARRAGQEIVALARERTFEVHEKSGTELVTTADLRSEALIREHLLSTFPAHRFLSEEADGELIAAGELDFAGPVWIVDPLDGTANYVHGHPHVGVSVALAVDGEPVVGVVHAPFLDETFAAVRGQGATRNGQAIHVSRTAELHRALVGTGFPHERSDVTVPIERVRRLVTACQDIRRAGSPALDICWVAAGRLDAHCESLEPWDVAAAGLIATEAGALRGNLGGGPSSLPSALRGEGFIVATPALFEPLVRLLEEN
jgi:myo-inositol-1(or 4)-monophosphatase